MFFFSAKIFFICTRRTRTSIETCCFSIDLVGTFAVHRFMATWTLIFARLKSGIHVPRFVRSLVQRSWSADPCLKSIPAILLSFVSARRIIFVFTSEISQTLTPLQVAIIPTPLLSSIIWLTLLCKRTL